MSPLQQCTHCRATLWCISQYSQCTVHCWLNVRYLTTSRASQTQAAVDSDRLLQSQKWLHKTLKQLLNTQTTKICRQVDGGDNRHKHGRCQLTRDLTSNEPDYRSYISQPSCGQCSSEEAAVDIERPARRLHAGGHRSSAAAAAAVSDCTAVVHTVWDIRQHRRRRRRMLWVRIDLPHSPNTVRLGTCVASQPATTTK